MGCVDESDEDVFTYTDTGDVLERKPISNDLIFCSKKKCFKARCFVEHQLYMRREH